MFCCLLSTLCYTLLVHHLKDLNEKQKEAVLHTKGPLLILAGAGAGKTKTISHRILHLIKEGVAPHEILAITFTNKAGKELKERVHKLIETDPELNLPISHFGMPFVSTFHSARRPYFDRKRAETRLHQTLHHLRPCRFAFDHQRSDQKLGARPWSIRARQNVTYDFVGKGGGQDTRRLSVSHRQQLFCPSGSGCLAGLRNRFEKRKRPGFWRPTTQDSRTAFKTSRRPRALPKSLAIHPHRWVPRHQQSAILTRQKSGRWRKNICVVGDIDQTIYSWRGQTSAIFCILKRFCWSRSQSCSNKITVRPKPSSPPPIRLSKEQSAGGEKPIYRKSRRGTDQFVCRL